MWRAAAKPATKAAPVGDVAAALVPMAEVYLRAAGVGTIKDLAVWAGVAQRDAAAGQLGAIAVEVEGQAEPRVILPEARGLVDDADVDGAVALLPFEDNLLALGTPGLLIEPAYHRRQVPTWGSSKKSALGDARHLSQRTVVAESKIVGFWDCDPDARGRRRLLRRRVGGDAQAHPRRGRRARAIPRQRSRPRPQLLPRHRRRAAPALAAGGCALTQP